MVVEICSGTSHFRAAVWAESIERALKLVETRYPGSEARVIFPIGPEAFFVNGTVPPAEAVRLEAPAEVVE